MEVVEVFELAAMNEQVYQILLPYAHDPASFSLLDNCVGRLLRRSGEMSSVDKGRLRHIADWLRAALVNDEPWLKNVDGQGRPKKLMKFGSIDAIVQEADKAMLKAAQKSRAVKLIDGDEELVEILDEGFHIVSLLTPAALDRESAQMQHCIGNGGYDEHLEDEGYLYLSLRDPQGKAHVTMEIEDGILIQLQGKQNAPPIRRYIDILVPYIRDRGLVVDVPAYHLGYVVDIDGEWHPLNNLPEGMTVKGNLNLSGTKITVLPEGISVGGNLSLCSTPITALPARLSVGGFLDLSGSSIKELSSGLIIGEGIDLSSTEITSLPAGLSVIGFLDLSGTPIRELPKGLMVGASLNLLRTKIVALPEGLIVGGNLNLSHSLIEALPKGMKVNGNLYVNHTPIASLPEGLTVRGVLDLRKTKITALPEGLSVTRDLYANHSSVAALPEGLTVGGSLYINETPITVLPKDLMVGDNLILDQTKITELPEDLKVGGEVYSTTQMNRPWTRTST